MSRRYILRYDIWICLLFGFLASLGVERIVTSIRTDQYEVHKAEHVVSAGEIGGEAPDDLFRAQDIDDLLSHDTFTVVSPGIEYRNRGAGYYNGRYFYSLTLPSGERVAAWINTDAVTKPDSDSIFTGDSVLPVGRIIMEDLTNDEYFIHQIEFKEPLTRTDFYVDMVGDSAIESEDSFIKGPVLLWQLLTIVTVFAILHYFGSKIGLFPAFYTRKTPEAEKKSDWD